jgi:hypothetical protein
VGAATHDTGIDFSAKDRTLIHKIDPQIDMERSKVVNDPLLTGKVQSPGWTVRMCCSTARMRRATT